MKKLIFALSGALFFASCRMPKGVELEGEWELYLPLGNVLGGQADSANSILGNFLDADVLDEQVNDVVSGLEVPQDRKDARKVWNDTEESIKVSDDDPPVNGRDDVQTFVVYFPVRWIELADLIADLIPEQYRNGDWDSLPQTVKNKINDRLSTLSFNPILLPAIGKSLELLEGLEYKNIYMLTYLHSGDGIESGTINITVRDDENGGYIEVLSGTNNIRANNHEFKDNRPPDTEDWEVNLADAVGKYTSAKSITDIINNKTESKVIVSFSDLTVNSLEKDDLEITVELAVVLPMSFSISGSEIIIGTTPYRKLEIGPFNNMQEEVNNQLDSLGDSADLLKTITITISDIHNDIITGKDLSVAFAEDAKGTSWKNQLISLVTGESKQDVPFDHGMKELPKVALVLPSDKPDFSIKPKASYGEKGAQFSFDTDIHAVADINMKIP